MVFAELRKARHRFVLESELHIIYIPGEEHHFYLVLIVCNVGKLAPLLCNTVIYTGMTALSTIASPSFPGVSSLHSGAVAHLKSECPPIHRWS